MGEADPFYKTLEETAKKITEKSKCTEEVIGSVAKHRETNMATNMIAINKCFFPFMAKKFDSSKC